MIYTSINRIVLKGDMRTRITMEALPGEFISSSQIFLILRKTGSRRFTGECAV
jgi:hypothetical protein